MKQLIIFLSIFLIFGCGSRKINKSKVITETKTIDSVKILAKTVLEINSETNSFEINPIDSLKPIIIIDNNGKRTSYLNAKLHNKREIKAVKETKEVIVNSVRKENIKVVNELKQTERQESYWWLLILAAILAVLFYISKR